MNLKLKTAILASGKSQRRIAFESGVHEDRLSRIVQGWRTATPSEQMALAAVLSCTPDVFESASRATYPNFSHPVEAA